MPNVDTEAIVARSIPFHPSFLLACQRLASLAFGANGGCSVGDASALYIICVLVAIIAEIDSGIPRARHASTFPFRCTASIFLLGLPAQVPNAFFKIVGIYLVFSFVNAIAFEIALVNSV